MNESQARWQPWYLIPKSRSNLQVTKHACDCKTVLLKWLYRPGVHEACLAQLVGVVHRGLGAEDATQRAPLARVAARLALTPNNILLPTLL